jgi:hypothetical protein
MIKKVDLWNLLMANYYKFSPMGKNNFNFDVFIYLKS